MRNTLASGVVPQLSAVMGPCAGGAVYSPAITDFIFMVESTSHMFITGPEVIRTVTHEEVSKEELGGAHTHTARSGVAHRAFSDEDACLAALRELLTFLPQNNREDPPRRPPQAPEQAIDGALDQLIPADPAKSYDMSDLIRRIVDDGICSIFSPRTRPTSWSASPVWMVAPSGSSRISDSYGRVPGHRGVIEGGSLRAVL